MDCIRVGRYILRLRKELGLTQKRLADTLRISDKTVSKWERGLGCPDVSILPDLAKALDVQTVEDEPFVTLNHPMTKEHYVSYVTYDRVYTVKLYPEQNPQFRFPYCRDGKFVVGCNRDGILCQEG
jgi:transcriptional regulator with XRE-family HTH domain